MSIRTTTEFLYQSKLFALLAFFSLLSLSIDKILAQDSDRSLIEECRDQFGSLEKVTQEKLYEAKSQLGQRLFWDPQISNQGNVACASCHLSQDGGADRRPFSERDNGKFTSHNSQTVFNAVLQPSLRWLGDRKDAGNQAEGSMTGSMGHASPDSAINKLKELDYEDEFRRAFPADENPLSITNLGKAIAAYESTLVTPSRFDEFQNGDGASLSESAKRGLRLFMETGCADCHNGKLLGGSEMAKFGIHQDYWLLTRSKKIDEGLFGKTGEEKDRYQFRVGMLRNITRTAPYFHDGSVEELKDAVKVMAATQLGLELAEGKVTDILEFLKSLEGEIPANFRAPDAYELALRSTHSGTVLSLLKQFTDAAGKNETARDSISADYLLEIRSLVASDNQEISQAAKQLISLLEK